MADTKLPSYREEAVKLIKPVQELHRKSSFLSVFNSVAAGILPAATAVTSFLLKDHVPVHQTLIAGSFLLAATTQLSRWQKGKIRDGLENLWNTTAPEIRGRLLEYVRETLDKKIGHSTHVIGFDDFNLKNIHVIIPLATTAGLAYAFPPIAPVAFFSGTQAREWADSARLEVATRYTLMTLDSAQRNFL